MALESEVLRSICDYLATKKDLYFWRQNNVPVFSRNNAGRMAFRALPKYTPKGLPDIFVIVGGNFLAIEVKKDAKQKLRPEQETFALNFTMHGGKFYKVSSIDEVADILDKIHD